MSNITSSNQNNQNGPKSQKKTIIVGSGLAGLVAAYEIIKQNQKVIIIDQENEKNLGGQAFWSLGGIFLIDSPEQRFMGVKDSIELAKRDWFNSAQFDKIQTEDEWAIKWANEYLKFSNHGMRDYLHTLGLKFVSTVGWAERGDGNSSGHGNSVPRFHVTWGTGPEIVRIFVEPLLKAKEKGLIEFKFRHQVNDLILNNAGKVIGVKGKILEPSNKNRGFESSRLQIDEFELYGNSIVISTGGIGGNIEMIKKMWPKEKMGGFVPKTFVTGVPHHVDGKMISIVENKGASVVNKDRMWHYTEGLTNWNPIWPNHGIRVIPGPSSLWLDAKGKRLPSPYFPGCDTRGTLKKILSTGYDFSWFILNESILHKEFSLSGSEQNPDITGKSLWLLIKRILVGQEPVKKFEQNGIDFVVSKDLKDLVQGMNKLQRDGAPPLKYDDIFNIINDRDSQITNGYSKDNQIHLIKNSLSYFGDRWSRCQKLHKILDPSYGPLVAVRMNILSRKTLGGLQTNLHSQVLKPDGTVFEGLYAAGECAGFGGGGLHGYNALEGTFLTGCVFSGRAAGISIATDLNKIGAKI